MLILNFFFKTIQKLLQKIKKFDIIDIVKEDKKEMENKNGKGIFYGVIGVATLIVAIIGATFAYFTATTASGQYLTGTAATASL